MINDRVIGRDLSLGLTADEFGWYTAGPTTQGDLVAVRGEGPFSRAADLAVAGGTQGIAQAIVLRLMTERGELSNLGHPSYGSRHHELIGEPNTPTNRERIKLFILDALREERRIERVLAVEVRVPEGRQNRDRVHVTLSLLLRGEPDPLNLVVPFSFAGGSS